MVNHCGLLLASAVLTYSSAYAQQQRQRLPDWSRISPEGAIERFLNAEAEYFEAGGVDAVTRALQIDEGEVLVPRTLVFGMEEARASPWNVACFRFSY